MSEIRHKTVIHLVGMHYPVFAVEPYEWVREKIETALESEADRAYPIEVTSDLGPGFELTRTSFAPFSVVAFSAMAKEIEEAA